MADTTYTPNLVGKSWDAHGAREVEEALQRLANSLNSIISELSASGITDVITGAVATFYQTVMKSAAAVEQRAALDFVGNVVVSDAGDRTIVRIEVPASPHPDGSTENLDDYFKYKATENYALRQYTAMNFR